MCLSDTDERCPGSYFILINIGTEIFHRLRSHPAQYPQQALGSRPRRVLLVALQSRHSHNPSTALPVSSCQSSISFKETKKKNTYVSNNYTHHPLARSNIDKKPSGFQLHHSKKTRSTKHRPHGATNTRHPLPNRSNMTYIGHVLGRHPEDIC